MIQLIHLKTTDTIILYNTILHKTMTNQQIYNLSAVPGFVAFATNNKLDVEYEKYYTSTQYSTKANDTYTIIKYNKEMLAVDLIPTYGLLRSVIIRDTKVVCFSPQKSIACDDFMNKYSSNFDEIVVEEFLEGTMINVFYDGIANIWQISTRNTVGADVTFFKDSGKTFNIMFMEACALCGLDINYLNPAHCYSFVLQHPENRIVVPFQKPTLYLVGIYEIVQTNDKIMVKDLDMQDITTNCLWDNTMILIPEKYKFTSYTDLIHTFGSPNTPYNVMGIIIKNKVTGDRTKIRNPIYEEVRHLRGNQPKLQYQYLFLRHTGKIPDFLKHYPEKKPEFSMYRDQVHMFTTTLHKNYLSCYVRKEKPLNEFSAQYKTHMFKIHELFLDELRPKKLYVSNTVVINYVNKLHPSLLMYCLNYNMRKRAVDIIISKE